MLLSFVARCRFLGISKNVIIGGNKLHLQHAIGNPNARAVLYSRDSNTSYKLSKGICRSTLIHQSRTFHTTRPQNANPLLLAVLRPISKIIVVLVGRGFRKWWQSLSGQKRKLIIQHFKDNIRLYLFGSVIVGAGGYSYYEEHVTVTPFTGRKRFMIFTPQQLDAISEEMYAEEMERYPDKKMAFNHPMVEQVTRVGNQLLHGNRDIPQIYRKSWTVTVIDDPIVNCYVLPCGNIIMFKGMMDLLENDDQLAAVLGHEMSHAILEHAAEQLSHGYLLDMLILLPLAVIWAFMPSDGIAAITHWFLHRVVSVIMQLPYSRNIEEEADTVGLQLAAKACYDVREASAFWGKMSILEQQAGEQGPEFLSTHPNNSSRQQQLDEQMDDALKIRENCHCPKLTVMDPRYSVLLRQRQLKVDPPKSL